MSAANEGQDLLDDSLDVFTNDQDGMGPNTEILLGVATPSVTTTVDVDDVDNIKPPYPEDTVDDEGQLVDEHDGGDKKEDDLDEDTLESNNVAPTSGSECYGTLSSHKPRRKRDATATVMRKAPQAPKRFKSSYICFFTAKQTEIKGILGDKATVKEISKMSAQMWKELGADERAHWDDLAAKDKERYMMEKAVYRGPWQVPYKRAKKDPSAPKRPMSAFLLFSQGRRGKVKDQHPGMKNTEVSRVLGEEWRNCTDEERLPFVEQEKFMREKYKVDLSEWKEKEEERREAESKQRKEQLEWLKQQHQQALQQAQQYAQHQQSDGVTPPLAHSYPHHMYMHSPHAPLGYPGYQQQEYAPQYAPYPPQVYHYGSSANSQQPVIVGSSHNAPQYAPMVHQQHQRQQDPLPHSSLDSRSASAPPQVYFQQTPVVPTDSFNDGQAGIMLPDTSDLDHLTRGS